MEINNATLAAQFQATTNSLIGLLETFTPDTFNRKPAPTAWNAGDVAEHLLLFDLRLQEILATAIHPADRNPAEKIAEYTGRVTNREVRIDAPPFLVPEAAERNPADMIAKLKAVRNHIVAAMATQDLTLISTDFPHRFFGEMTAFEWIHFLDLHTHRHFPQLRELLEDRSA
ncbi:MAG: DinB family protein [Chitinophagaceae bacterium]|nr:DinB family protein [Chitinophagaceae bacterium]MCA6456010.1 DinB family protein [Chitinophagaceae bacterium]MCA6457675.1 DinB family protein [Chitinophagaceae bacterium]MCA6463388.1 DinB family protein [Chitinophagaceae bacterium]